MEPGKEFYMAFLKAQKELGPAKKNSVNPHFRSKFADLESCYDACIDILNKNDLLVKQDTLIEGEFTYLSTDIVHAPTCQKTRSVLYIGPKTFKAQEEGSALTYKRRYGLVTAVGLATSDDDGNAASGKDAKEKVLNISEPGEFPILFGPNKGKRIKDVSDKELENAIKWCRENKKFPEFQESALSYLDKKTQMDIKK